MEDRMSWLVKTLWTSIGKKLLMAGTGLCFCGFLVVHLAGNMTLYGGSESFDHYSEKLHQLGIFVTVIEWGLVGLALIHVVFGLILFFADLRAKPVRYHVHKRAGGRTLGSATMPYTGIVILAFVIYHLSSFRFTGDSDLKLYQIVIQNFHHPGVVIFYLIALVVIAIHISHGFWSAFQTLGLDHIKYTPLIKAVRTVLYVVVAAGFGSIPVYLLLM